MAPATTPVHRDVPLHHSADNGAEHDDVVDDRNDDDADKREKTDESDIEEEVNDNDDEGTFCLLGCLENTLMRLRLFLLILRPEFIFGV